MGASYRRLGIATLEALTGAGVFYGGPTSEASSLSGKAAYVVGGGNSAGQAALHLARFAREVTMIVRAASLERSMSHYLVETIAATPNIRVRTDTTIVGGGGEGHLEELILRHGASGEQERVAADALFILIGARPQTDWLPEEIGRDQHGFLLTGEEIPPEDWPLERRPLPMETSQPGVVAVGDIRSGSVKRVAAAVGAGSIAIQMVHPLIDAA
jgi:thioredoxin reductase (NADPH)